MALKPKTEKRRRLLLGVLIDRRGQWRIRGEHADNFFSPMGSMDKSLMDVLDSLKAAEESGAAVEQLLSHK